MTTSKLIDEYKELNPFFNKLYVVPLINYPIKNTDYLYLLYKPLLDDPAIELNNLSVFKHYRLITGGIKNSLLHYHWFEAKDLKSLLGIFWKLFWILFYKLLGGKIIWTVHNKYPHADSYLKLNKVLRKFLAHRADKLHVHCNYAAELMQAILDVNKEKFFIVEHPLYPALNMSKDKALEKLREKYSFAPLSENNRIFLSFGSIAPYKGIDGLIKIFSRSNQEDTLLIAGGVKRGADEYYQQLLDLSKNSTNIIFTPSVIPDEDVPYFFNAADYTIFNYTDILTSGAVILALSYNKPVIAPALGCIKEISNKNLVLFENQGQLATILRELHGERYGG